MTTVTQIPTANNPDYLLEQCKGKYVSMVLMGVSEEHGLEVSIIGKSISLSDVIYMLEKTKLSLLDGDLT